MIYFPSSWGGKVVGEKPLIVEPKSYKGSEAEQEGCRKQLYLKT